MGPSGNCRQRPCWQKVYRERGRVVLPAGLQTEKYLMEQLRRKHCQLVFAEPANTDAEPYRNINLGLALTTLEQLGLATAPALQAMLAMPRDLYDFHIARCGGAQVAMAFSANDIASTRMLFESLKWSPGETRLIYNHRADRPGRLKSFVDWLGQSHWREVLVIGDRPRTHLGFARYLNMKSAQGLVRLFQPGDRIFGCGNIAGLPLSLAAVLDR